MAYSKVKLKMNGDKAYPCSRSFWLGCVLDKCLPIQTSLLVSFKHISVSLTCSKRQADNSPKESYRL
jgi:hypothetical protein